MRIGFAGTPDFAATILAALLANGQRPELVLTQPDRPQGRGLKLTPSPVKQLAQQHALAILQPSSLKTEDARAPLIALPLDVLLVAAYGLILPPAILNWPRLGCINVHASLLPRWRGAAPIHRAIEAGDHETGVTLMQMDVGLDTGAMIAFETLAIEDTDTTASLHDKLAKLGAELAVAALHDLAQNGSLPATPQSENGITYAQKIERVDALIDWKMSAIEIDRRVRAFNPFPIAFTLYNGQPCKIWRASVASVEASGQAPGTILSATNGMIIVACGTGSLSIQEVQLPGNKRIPVQAFLAGHPLKAGFCFGK